MNTKYFLNFENSGFWKILYSIQKYCTYLLIFGRIRFSRKCISFWTTTGMHQPTLIKSDEKVCQEKWRSFFILICRFYALITSYQLEKWSFSSNFQLWPTFKWPPFLTKIENWKVRHVIFSEEAWRLSGTSSKTSNFNSQGEDRTRRTSVLVDWRWFDGRNW